jgi:hypothetical protein
MVKDRKDAYDISHWDVINFFVFFEGKRNGTVVWLGCDANLLTEVLQFVVAAAADLNLFIFPAREFKDVVVYA